MSDDQRPEIASTPVTPWLTIVGIGEDGLAGLNEAARAAIATAQVVVGGERHLAMIPEAASHARRIAWPSPMLPLVDEIIGWRGQPICVLASGDPMLYGVGSTFARRLPPAELWIIPQVSAFALACARLGWPEEHTTLITIVGRPIELLHPHLQPGRRLIVFTPDGAAPAAIAALLVQQGFGLSRLTVWSHLGGAPESQLTGTAQAWPYAQTPRLNTVAIECRCEADTVPLPTTPGLPDEAYLHDGQLTKREIRAITLARLAPMPQQLLWDVGAGAGSISIEWMRTHPSCRAIAIEQHPTRLTRIQENSLRLGVPGLQIVPGTAPAALEGLERPQVVFVGGGLTAVTIDRCWEALLPGGRLVANAVTLESESLLVALRSRLGGELTRLSIDHAEPLGHYLGWRPQRPVVQWVVVKPT
jgi:precorrin-6B C5,15-methyltransferase / cobalt-precorrin-6B C5,C15-methyltransferase